MYTKTLLFIAFLAPIHTFQASSICIRTTATKIKTIPAYKQSTAITHTYTQTAHIPLNMEKLQHPSRKLSQHELDETKADEYMKKHPGKAILFGLCFVAMKQISRNYF